MKDFGLKEPQDNNKGTGERDGRHQVPNYVQPGYY